MAGLFQELKRRNVVRVGLAYIVVGWVVVQIGEVLFDAFGTPDWVIKTVIVLIALGFPFAILFAWAFELTPEGLMKTREVDLSKSITHNTGRKLDFVIIGALTLALGYFIWERQARDHTDAIVNEPVAAEIEADEASEPEPVATPDARRSIAVLPFVNMSSDQEQEYFADGLTEEILNSLAKAPDLLVAARTSSFGFKGSTQPIPEIATALGVDHVLEGSVRRGGETLRITAQLIRANDGFHLWSETFDRTMDDIIAIQEEIAIQIATALETAMDPEALEEMMQAGTASVAAYEAFLTGQGAVRAADETGDPYEGLLALESWERAIEIDPEFSRALARLSFFWYIQSSSNQLRAGITEIPREEMLQRRDDLLDRAIQHAKNDLEGKEYQATKALNNHDIQRARRLWDELVAERPNDDRFVVTRIYVYSILGKHQEISALIRDANEKFELTRSTANQYLQDLRTAEDAELMRIIAHESVEKFGNDVSVVYQAHRMMLWAGDIDGASQIVPRINASRLPDENKQMVQLRQLCAEGRQAEAAQKYEQLLAKYGENISATWITHMIMGQLEAAQGALMAIDEARDYDELMNYLSYPNFDPTVFPNFMEHMAGQGLEDRTLIPAPYRCNR
jgi:TolB-like protein